MAQASPKVLTYDEWLALPESMTRQEVIDGVIYVSPAPTSDHQWLLRNIAVELDAHVRARGLGVVLFAPLDIVISRDPVRTRQPDALFLSAERTGVLECWIISPEAETVEVSRSSPEDWVRVGLFGVGETIRSEVLPELDLSVDAIFA